MIKKIIAYLRYKLTSYLSWKEHKLLVRRYIQVDKEWRKDFEWIVMSVWRMGYVAGKANMPRKEAWKFVAEKLNIKKEIE